MRFSAVRGWLRLVCLLILLTVGGMSARAAEQVGGVIDYAGIFSPRDKRDLQERAARLAHQYKSDFFVVSVDDRAPQWRIHRSHYGMVEEVKTDVARAIQKHYQRSSNLTLLIVFKSSVVVHLATTDDRLAEYLLLNEFYGGAREAFKRVRGRSESHAEAVRRNLDEFQSFVSGYQADKEGLALQLDQARSKTYAQYALLASRNIVSYPWLDWGYRLLFPAVHFGATHAPVAPWIAFLVIMLAIYISVLCLRDYVSGMVGGIGGFLTSRMLAALLVPPLCFLFAVAQCDLENILYISQVFGGDLRSYLTWSLAFERNDFHIPWPVFFVVAVVFAGLSFYTEKDRIPGFGGSAILGSAILGSMVWTLSLVIWPGLVALCFMMITAGFHFWRIYRLPNRPGRQPVEGFVGAGQGGGTAGR